MDSIRRIIYSAESVPPQDAAQHWKELLNHRVQLTIGCMGRVHWSILDRIPSEGSKAFSPFRLDDLNPRICLELARQFVDEGEEARYHGRQSFDEAGPKFAFDVIGRLGDRSDLARLRKASQDEKLAWMAIDAIRRVDSSR
jgi:hypothetical protein